LKLVKGHAPTKFDADYEAVPHKAVYFSHSITELPRSGLVFIAVAHSEVEDDE